jgi:hypothetical protein
MSESERVLRGGLVCYDGWRRMSSRSLVVFLDLLWRFVILRCGLCF